VANARHHLAREVGVVGKDNTDREIENGRGKRRPRAGHRADRAEPDGVPPSGKVGKRSISLPVPSTVVDCFSGREVGRGIARLDVELSAAETAIYRLQWSQRA